VVQRPAPDECSGEVAQGGTSISWPARGCGSVSTTELVSVGNADPWHGWAWRAVGS